METVFISLWGPGCSNTLETERTLNPAVIQELQTEGGRAAPSSFLIFNRTILPSGKKSVRFGLGLVHEGSVTRRFQTFFPRKCNAGRHVVTSCVPQKGGHHVGVRVPVAGCISADVLMEDRCCRQQPCLTVQQQSVQGLLWLRLL